MRRIIQMRYEELDGIDRPSVVEHNQAVDSHLVDLMLSRERRAPVKSGAGTDQTQSWQR